MRHAALFSLLGLLVTLPAHAGNIEWVKVDGSIQDLRIFAQEPAAERQVKSGAPASLRPRASEPTSVVLLPSFKVDTTSAAGETTLFAVRNVTESAVGLVVRYHTVDGTVFRQELQTLGAKQTLTVNLRDVPGIAGAAGPDGIARGFAAVGIPGDVQALTGDYFQVNPGENFAQGARLFGTADLCNGWSIRFLDGGAFSGGTDYVVWVEDPQGTDPATADPTIGIVIYDEAGNFRGGYVGYTDDVVTEFSADEIDEFGDPLASGAYEVFLEGRSGQGGWIGASFSATGRFSVGVDSACLD